jgi:hypothetical protein
MFPDPGPRVGKDSGSRIRIRIKEFKYFKVSINNTSELAKILADIRKARKFFKSAQMLLPNCKYFLKLIGCHFLEKVYISIFRDVRALCRLGTFRPLQCRTQARS